MPGRLHGGRPVAAGAALLVVLELVAPFTAAGSNDAADRPHWRQRHVVVRDETGQPSWREALQWAADRWNEAAASIALEIADGIGSGCRDAVDGEVHVCRADLPPEIAGQTRAGGDSRDGHIEHASILVSAGEHATTLRRSIACHELGHALGLGHRDEPASCMHHTVGSPSPDSTDRLALRALYGHEDRAVCRARVVRVGTTACV